MRVTTLRAAGLATAVAGVVALAAAPAHAYTTWGGDFGNGYYFADNSNHTYYNNGLAPQHEIAMDYAMGTRLEATDMTTDKFESWNNDTDVVAYDDDYGVTTWRGQWHCEVEVSSSVCNRGEIEINLHNGISNSVLTCHEVGHSVGLLHYTLTDTCMYHTYSPTYPSDYNAHEKAHINAKY